MHQGKHWQVSLQQWHTKKWLTMLFLLLLCVHNDLEHVAAATAAVAVANVQRKPDLIQEMIETEFNRSLNEPVTQWV